MSIKSESLTRLLKELNKICKEVNQQMTVPNHHREIEQFTIDEPALAHNASIETRKAAIAKATQEKLDKEWYKKCEEHDAKEWAERLLFTALKSNPDFKVALEKAKNSQDQALKCAKQFLANMGSDYQMDEAAFRRYQQMDLLTEDRNGNCKSPGSHASMGLTGIKNSILKLGVGLERNKTRTGFCDEIAKLSLVKILKKYLGERVEYYGANLGDDCDGHAFLVINRAKDSDVTEFSTWGDECIIFDAWNETVTTVLDYELSLTKMLFIHCIVSATTYEYNPMRDMQTIRLIENDFTVFNTTGHLDLAKRRLVLVKEFELTKLDSDKYPVIVEELNKILDSYDLKNYNPDIDFYITTAGNKPVTFIKGFGANTIAIHIDFIRVCTLQQLAYSILVEYLHIVFHDSALATLITHDMRAFVENKLVKEHNFGNVAIDALQYSIKFCQDRKDEPNIVVPIDHELNKGNNCLYEERIKLVQTMLAADKTIQSQQVATTQQRLPASALFEVSAIERTTFYDYSALKQASILKYKLDRLIEAVPHLSSGEIFAYEYTRRPSRQVYEFCQQINTIKQELEQQYHRQTIRRTIDKLFNTLEEHSIYAYDYIYKELLDFKKFKRRHSFYYPIHGLYRKIQDAIDELHAACNVEMAEIAANKFLQLEQKYKYCLSEGSVRSHLLKATEYNKKIVGRLFAVGVLVDFNIPVLRNRQSKNILINYAQQSTQVARALFKMGLCLQPEIASQIPFEELMQRSFVPRIFESAYQYEDRELYIDLWDKKTKLRSNILQDSDRSFDERVGLYLLNNLQKIIGKKLYKFSPANVLLLSHMAVVAKYGTMQERNEIKRFFLSRTKGLSFFSLTKVEPILRKSLNYPYAEFVLNNKFVNIEFDLFNKIDKLSFLMLDKFNGVSYSDFADIILGKNRVIDARTVSGLTHLITESLNIKLKLDIEKHNVNFLQYEILSAFVKEVRPKYIKLSADFVSFFDMVQKYNDIISTRYEGVCSDEFVSDYQLGLMPAYMLIRGFRRLDGDMNLNEPIIRSKLVKLITEKIGALVVNNKCSDVITACKQILFVVARYAKLSESEYVSKSRISDYALRKLAIDNLAKAFLAKYGKDDGSDKYFDSIKSEINEIFEYCSSADINKLMIHLANTLVTKEKLSEYIGKILEPDEYKLDALFEQKQQSMLYICSLSRYFGEDVLTRMPAIEFFSSKITAQSLTSFVEHLVKRSEKKDENGLLSKYNLYQMLNIKDQLHESNFKETMLAMVPGVYHDFWSSSLQARSLAIDYLLIPANQTKDKNSMYAAFNEAFDYIIDRIFDRNKDEFAIELLKSYLKCANKFEREFLMSALIVTSNEYDTAAKSTSLGAKFASICENMGPAYIKLAQAVHSHPNTPIDIKQALDGIKGRACPPTRWHLYRMLKRRLPDELYREFNKVSRILGSASFNIALKVTHDSEKKVLTLLRDNAKEDSKRGFVHLYATVDHCQHSKVMANKSDSKRVITKAQELSLCEMSDDISSRQFEFAKEIYSDIVIVSNNFVVQLKPCGIYNSGEGYRVIERAYGEEFNDISNAEYNIPIKQAVAYAVVKTELLNILKGNRFDCDRHGNQLRIQRIGNLLEVKLYDFGEMALDLPNQAQLSVLKLLINHCFNVVYNNQELNIYEIFESLIKKYHPDSIEVDYLTRLQKAVLALNDFAQYLTKSDFKDIISNIYNEHLHEISPVIRSDFSSWCKWIYAFDMLNKVTTTVKNTLRLGW